MMKTTRKQKMLVEAIECFIEKNGYAPTVRELAIMLESSPNAVFSKMVKLEEQGIISTIPGKARTVKILVSGEELDRS